MEGKLAAVSNKDLYEHDFYEWAKAQAALLRLGCIEELDVENLAEEIESMGRSDKREVLSRLIILIHHLLKWEHQQQGQKIGWLLTIKEQRRQLGLIFKDSPSLKRIAIETLYECYEAAVDRTADETGILKSVFPEACPYRMDQIFDPGFFPKQGI